MPYINTKDILKYARDHNFAHGAFNVNTLCQAKAIIEACEELRSAAIIQVAEPGLAFIGGNTDFLNGTIEDKKKGAKIIANYVKKLAKKTFIPVALHLDHGRSFETCKICINAGFNSVMIDGSSLPYEENVALAKKVVNYAHKFNVSVEGELGVLAGTEDHVFSSSSTYTNPITAIDFLKRTNIDLLAISYGTKHGAVKGDNVVYTLHLFNDLIRYFNSEFILNRHNNINSVKTVGAQVLNNKAVGSDAILVYVKLFSKNCLDFFKYHNNLHLKK